MIIAIGVILGGYLGTGGDASNIPEDLKEILLVMFSYVVGRQALGMVTMLKGKTTKIK